ncbi:hypothetical protein EBT31_15995, partial [bacterium]|nr:hypothetical protein [bacterium]
YIGVTSNLEKRIKEHELGMVDGFSKRYHANNLIYFEHTSDIYSAITREKQLKGWTRKRKIELIKRKNAKLETISLHEDPSVDMKLPQDDKII